jgi:hypothetical protein
MDKLELFIGKIKEHKVTHFVMNPKFLLIFTILMTIILATHKYILSMYYNNHLPPEIYMIYKQSLLDLIHMKDIFVPVYDDYLYSPTFPLLMFPFAFLHDYIGSLLWDIVNALALFFATRLIFPTSDWKKLLLYLIVCIEAVVALQNFQVNSLAAALMVFTYAAFERDKTFLAALCIAVGFFIKLYGLGFAILFLFYPNKKKFLVYLFSLCVILFLLPLVFINFDFNHLIFLYKQWLGRLGTTIDTEPNIPGLLRTWFGVTSHTVYAIIAALGLFITALPLLRRDQYKEPVFRLLYFSALMIWIIIFSSKSESQTYIIAMFGIGSWFILQKPTKGLIIWFIVMFYFACLGSTDALPPYIRGEFYNPYGLQAITPTVMWVLIMIDLFKKNFKGQTLE